MRKFFSGAFIVCGLLASTGHAAVNMSLYDNGTDVTLSVSGQLDLDALLRPVPDFNDSHPAGIDIEGGSFRLSSGTLLEFGDIDSPIVDLHGVLATNVTGPTSVFSNGDHLADSTSGDLFAFGFVDF